MIEAHIRPEDINNVQLGQHARVKFTAFKYRNTLMVTGKVTYVSGDRLIDRATQPALLQRDDPRRCRRRCRPSGDLKLQAGMPAEVYIEGPKQTPLQYLVEPITSTIRKAGRQM